MKIVTMSDTHDSTHLLPNVPDGDVVIHCGDFTYLGAYDELQRFKEWFSSLPHKHKIVIPGNHELSLGDDRRVISESYLENFHYLVDKELIIDGVKFYGSPWNGNLPRWAFYSDDCDRIWNFIPEDVDILITHSPPYGILDKSINGRNFGCPYLAKHVKDRIRPNVHIFGHIHEGRGTFEEDGIQYINTSSLDAKHKPVRPFPFFEFYYQNSKIHYLWEN